MSVRIRALVQSIFGHPMSTLLMFLVQIRCSITSCICNLLFSGLRSQISSFRYSFPFSLCSNSRFSDLSFFLLASCSYLLPCFFFSQLFSSPYTSYFKPSLSLLCLLQFVFRHFSFISCSLSLVTSLPLIFRGSLFIHSGYLHLLSCSFFLPFSIFLRFPKQVKGNKFGCFIFVLI